MSTNTNPKTLIPKLVLAFSVAFGGMAGVAAAQSANNAHSGQSHLSKSHMQSKKAQSKKAHAKKRAAKKEKRVERAAKLSARIASLSPENVRSGKCERKNEKPSG